MKKILGIFFLLSLVTSHALATSYYVQKGATGNNNGTSWANAWNELNQINMATVAGTNTVYIGGGTYTTTLDITVDGTSDANRLIFRKATAADHGADGTYGSGEVYINGRSIYLNDADYVTIDGATRSADGLSGYGIRLTGQTGVEAAIHSEDNTYVTLRYIFMDGSVYGPEYVQDGMRNASLTNSIIEYCRSDGYYSSNLHGDGLASYSWNNVTFRYNVVNRSTQFLSFAAISNIKVYGNIFFIDDANSPDYKANNFQTNSSSGSNLFYNNVVNSSTWGWSGVPGMFAGGAGGGTWTFRNNYFTSTDVGGVGEGTHTNNAYNTNCVFIPTEATRKTGTAAALGITNEAADDYTITSTSIMRDAGYTLASPYNIDFIGNTRGADGTFDIGAYEYTSGTDTTAPTVTAFTIPSTASSLTVSITTFTATDAVGVTGYKLTELSTPPGAGDAGWTGTAPATYVFGTAGAKTLYAWAKDAAGNVSTSLNDSVTITLPSYKNIGSPHSMANKPAS